MPKTGYPLELVDARWLNKSSIWQLVRTGARVCKGTLEARRVIGRFKPDVVIGTGGYVCFPVVMAAKMYGAKTFLHEQNAYPGLANRMLEKYVNKIFLGFGDAAGYFKNPGKTLEAGNPVRKSFFILSKTDARKKLGFGQDDFIVFSFGGSLGAEKINEVAFEVMQALNGHEKTQMIFGTGKWYYQQVLERAAGALSVAETTVCGKAAILIPSPNVTGNHQYFNAKAVADRGGAILIEERDLDRQKLVEEVLKLKNNPERLDAMSRASRACAPDLALDIIYNTVVETVKK